MTDEAQAGPAPHPLVEATSLRWVWIAQAIAWTAWLAAVFAALSGMLGAGPLAS